MSSPKGARRRAPAWCGGGRMARCAPARGAVTSGVGCLPRCSRVLGPWHVLTCVACICRFAGWATVLIEQDAAGARPSSTPRPRLRGKPRATRPFPVAPTHPARDMAMLDHLPCAAALHARGSRVDSRARRAPFAGEAVRGEGEPYGLRSTLDEGCRVIVELAPLRGFGLARAQNVLECAHLRM